MLATRLCASSSVERRVESGKLPRTWMSLSVKSMESWGCCFAQLEQTVSQRNKKLKESRGGKERNSRLRHPDSQSPGFDVLFIPTGARRYQFWPSKKCSICSFHTKRTSEIKLSLLERVQVGERALDELRREPHLWFLWLSLVVEVLVIWLCWGLPLSKVLGFAVGSVVLRLGFGRQAVSSVSCAAAIRFFVVASWCWSRGYNNGWTIRRG